jgi:hypothetical protein
MARPKSGNPKQDNTIHIQFRWNPEYDEPGDEKDALAILQEYIDLGDTPREVFRHALIAFKGKKITKQGTQREVLRALNRIEGKIDQQAIEMNELIVKALQGMDLSQYVNHETHRSIAEELGSRMPESVYNQMFQSIEAEDFDVD